MMVLGKVKGSRLLSRSRTLRMMALEKVKGSEMLVARLS